MINELNLLVNFKFPDGFEIYSPTATASSNLIGLGLAEVQKISSGILPKNKIEQQAGQIIQDLFEFRNIEFHRTIATDLQLAELLVAELENRQVDLLLRGKTVQEGHDHRKLSNQASLFFGGHKDHLVLIAEWDTFYGRSLPEIFVQVIRQEHNEGLNPSDPPFLPPDSSVNWVHRYSYLRGLDGIVPGSKDIQEPQPVESNSKGNTEKLRQEEPIGRSQYDYLRRLGQHISLGAATTAEESGCYPGHRNFGKRFL